MSVDYMFGIVGLSYRPVGLELQTESGHDEQSHAADYKIKNNFHEPRRT